MPLTHRSLLRTAGLSSLAITGSAAAKQFDPSLKWDKEAHIIVVGFGGAGAASAITAHDAGSEVLILEKNAAAGRQYRGFRRRLYDSR